MAEILRTKIGREAYSRQFNMNPDQLDSIDQDGYDILVSVQKNALIRKRNLIVVIVIK